MAAVLALDRWRGREGQWGVEDRTAGTAGSAGPPVIAAPPPRRSGSCCHRRLPLHHAPVERNPVDWAILVHRGPVQRGWSLPSDGWFARCRRPSPRRWMAMSDGFGRPARRPRPELAERPAAAR